MHTYPLFESADVSQYHQYFLHIRSCDSNFMYSVLEMIILIVGIN